MGQQQISTRRDVRLTYTIEARELTNEYTHRPSGDAELARTSIEAADPTEALTQFVRRHSSELVSLSRPLGRESIATVKKDDSVYLVRIYQD
jgi:hypothetical protein